MSSFYGADRSGSAVQWLTGWPVTREAAAVVGPGETDALFVQFYNHLPLARQLAVAADVHWGGESTIVAAVDELCRRAGGASVSASSARCRPPPGPCRGDGREHASGRPRWRWRCSAAAGHLEAPHIVNAVT